jgi:serine/threonine-protein kinase
MGVVWRARDRRLERDVAVKVLRPFVADDPEQRRRFDREARTLAALSNEHIVRVYDYAEDADGDSYLVMEFIAGANLASTTFARLPIKWKEAVGYALPVSRALDYAHKKGLIHRDLTPANILIEEGTGRVVTTDFGLARIARGATSITATGALIGTPEYWSPEQAVGRDNDGSTDMYALGCVLFKLLSGRLPFEGEDRLAIGLRRAHEDAPSLSSVVPTVESGAIALVDALLSRDPIKRPTAEDVVHELENLGSTEEVGSRRPVAEPARATQPQRAPASVGVAATQRLPENLPTGILAPRTPKERHSRAWIFAAVSVAMLAALVTATVLSSTHNGHGAPSTGKHSTLSPARLRPRSRPPVTKTMPDLGSLSLAQAEARLHRSLGGNWVSGIHVRRAYSSWAPLGRVANQQPAAGTKVRDGVSLTLIMSKGRSVILVPGFSVVSRARDAVSELHALGLKPRVRYMPSWQVRKGGVIRTEPTTNTRLHRGERVIIFASSGKPRSAVPNVANTLLRIYSPGRVYSMLLPSGWRFRDASYPSDHATHLWWRAADPQARAVVVLSGCAGCVSAAGHNPNPAGAVSDAVSTHRMNADELAFAGPYNQAEAGYEDNGIVIVTKAAGGHITGYVRVDLWLPSSQDALATRILNSFQLLK